MGLVKSFLLWRRWRDTPHSHLAEIHELVILAARRCAYDLKHASDGIIVPLYDKEDGKMFLDRAHHWLSIFTTNDQGKQYRHRLHQDLGCAENKIKLYRKWFEDNNIEDPYPDLPF